MLFLLHHSLELHLLLIRNLGVLDYFGLLLVELVNPICESYVTYELKPPEFLPAEEKGKRPYDYHARSANDASLQGGTFLCQRNAEVVERANAHRCQDDCHQELIVVADQYAGFVDLGLKRSVNVGENEKYDTREEHSPYTFPKDSVFDLHIVFLQNLLLINEHQAEH